MSHLNLKSFEITKTYSIYMYITWFRIIFQTSLCFQWVYLWSWSTCPMTSWVSNCYGGLGTTPTPTSMTDITGFPGPATTSILLSPQEWLLSSMESIGCLLKTRISFRVQGKVKNVCIRNINIHTCKIHRDFSSISFITCLLVYNWFIIQVKTK